MATMQTAKEVDSKKRPRELKDQAATAALYVTHSQGKTRKSTELLDTEGKLSSASAALSLKHAQPRDLPSFPIVGVVNTESSAGAAASLAAANQTSFEHWKPDALPHANKAAYLAKDYKAEPLWEPELGTAGSKAALLAHRKGVSVELWQSSATPEGHSAAGQAMRKKGLSPKMYRGIDKEAADGALTAATGAFASERYPRPFPPVPPPDRETGALNAATKAHAPRPKKHVSVPNDLPGMSAADAKRIHDAAVTNLSREMYTAAPPVAPEIEERNRKAGLNAAAISMAKQMYEAQQKNTAAGVAARNASTRKSEGDDDLRGAAQRYIHLQDAARKLASERLAKLHDENAAYKNYYGQQPAPRRGMSLRSRRRSSGDEDSDPRRAQQIRSQMIGLSRGVQEVDEKKRKTDRDALLEAARRNVRQSILGMDEKVFADTGKASPAMQAEWEEKARTQAKELSAKRLETHGKVAIGGGKYLDQAEINAIAAARVQPELDRITAKAERDRAKDEANRKAEENRRLETEERERIEKERKRTADVEWRRFKEEEKSGKKRQKEEEKERKAEEKRLQKERGEEAEWAAVREKERAKEEEEEAKREQDALRKAEKEHEAKLAAEFEAIKDEEKRKSREQKHKHEKDVEAVEKEQEKSEKEPEEDKAAADGEEERDEVAKEMHEIALKVRQEARAAAVLQYLQQEQEKVKAEEEQKREEEQERETSQKEWQEKARQEELEKVDREIDELNEEQKMEKKRAKELKGKQAEFVKVDRDIDTSLDGTKDKQNKLRKRNEDAEGPAKLEEQKKSRTVGKRGSISKSEPKDKGKRKSSSFGAMAAALGLGLGEREREKEPVAHESDASTSLESLSSDERPNKVVAEGDGPQQKAVQQIAPAPSQPTTTVAVVQSESQAKEPKRSSWFRRLGRRSSRPEKSEKLTKTPNEPRVTEPATGLAIDPAEENPGIGTDNVPHIHVEDEQPKLLGLHQSQTATSVSTAATSPSQATSGKPSISAPIHTRPIQNSAGFAAQLPPTFVPGPSAALEPGVPPSDDSAHEETVEHPISEAPPTLCPPVSLQQANSSAREIALAGRQHDEAGEEARHGDDGSTDLDSSNDDAESLRHEPAVQLGQTISRGRLTGAPDLPDMGGSELMSSQGKEGGVIKEGSWLKNGDEADEEEWQEAHDRFDAEDLPLPVIRPSSELPGSPSKGPGGTRFKEEL